MKRGRGFCNLRRNTVYLGQLLLVVNIDLRECDSVRTRQLPRQLFVDGGDHLAWSTPVCVNCRARKKSSYVVRSANVLLTSGVAVGFKAGWCTCQCWKGTLTVCYDNGGRSQKGAELLLRVYVDECRHCEPSVVWKGGVEVESLNWSYLKGDTGKTYVINRSGRRRCESRKKAKQFKLLTSRKYGIYLSK